MKEVVTVLECAGNRRKTMSEQKEVDGILWDDGAICNTKWTGVPLREVLLRVGVKSAPINTQRYVCFASHASACEHDKWYGASIPLEKALEDDEDVLLANEMNGEPLTPDHGFPLCVVIPGYCGVRWVKWLDRITIMSTESQNFYRQKDHKVLPTEVETPSKAKEWWSKIPSLQELWLNSAITSFTLLHEQQIKMKEKSDKPREAMLLTVLVKGYAINQMMSLNERRDKGISLTKVCKVDVSGDGGKTWVDARITYQEGKWSWTLWGATLKIHELDSFVNEGCDSKVITIWSRAHDDIGAIQKRHGSYMWNLRGIAYDGYGQSKIELRST